MARCSYFFILAVPNQFRYPVWGQEPGSLTHRHRRLPTQEWIFSPAYYFTVGKSGNAVKCCIISASLWLDYLHTSLFIPIYQTAVITNIYLFEPAMVCKLFILLFKLLSCNGPETELKCKTGFRNYTGCFTTLGHNCRRWFPRSLWWTKFI